MFKNAIFLQRLWDNAEGAAGNVHRVVIFRRRFTLAHTLAKPIYRIAADSDFIAAVDGCEFCRGQFIDDPSRKSWNSGALASLAAGEHLIAVKVYFCGENFASYAPGRPGFYFELRDEYSDFVLDGDAGWRTLPDPAFKAGTAAKISSQLGFTTEYDLRRSVDWAAPELNDRHWAQARSFAPDPAIAFAPRPPGTQCRMRPFRAARLIAAGMFERHDLARPASAAVQMATDITFQCESGNCPPTLPATLPTLPAGPEFGSWFVADLDGEETGFIEFEIDAPEGTVIDYAHGEHLTDGHVRMAILGRNFADRCIARAGRNIFTLPFRRAGLRYLEFHLSPIKTAPVVIHRIGVRPWRLALPETARFQCAYAGLNELHAKAVHTLELCMHEHYEDCPWREQALYTYDSALQMLYGYYLWGNGDFAAASLGLFPPGQRSDGHLRLCAPGRSNTVIPIYTWVWLEQLYEHWMFTGSDQVFREHRHCADRIVDTLLRQRDLQTGLYRPGTGDYWNFYEWSQDLDGRGRVPGVHALYNLYLLAGLDAYIQLRAHQGEDCTFYQQAAAELRSRLDPLFYDPRYETYASYRDRDSLFGPYHEHTASMMLRTKSVPENHRSQVVKHLLNGDLAPVSLSSLPQLVRALAPLAEVPDDFFMTLLHRHYEKMLHTTGDTLWETAAGSDAFLFAGSLCHGWSALPAYFAGAVVLGVTPLEPGFRKFQVAPRLGKLAFAAGTVPTPAGWIEVEARSAAKGRPQVCVRHPEALACVSCAEPVSPA